MLRWLLLGCLLWLLSMLSPLLLLLLLLPCLLLWLLLLLGGNLLLLLGALLGLGLLLLLRLLLLLLWTAARRTGPHRTRHGPGCLLGEEKQNFRATARRCHCDWHCLCDSSSEEGKILIRIFD